MISKHSQQTDSIDALLGEIATEFSERLAGGENPSIEQYAKEYPHIASMIREVFPALNLLKDNRPVAVADTATSESKTLGDFRLIREIGRGGMGVVYEAEQISLGRTVALKVLPFAAVTDQKAIKRFKNEARAAATLDHPHIVPVIAVGDERGVYYYAMSLIHGITLADVIGELRQRVVGTGDHKASSFSIDDILSGNVSDNNTDVAVSSDPNAIGLDQTLDSGSPLDESAEDLDYSASSPTRHDVQAAI
jgi:serine/threonine protein kinase